MAGERRTELSDFVVDLLTMIEEQLARSRADPAEKRAMLAVWNYAIAVLQFRLAGDEFQITRAMLLSWQIYNATWMDDRANAEHAAYSSKACALLRDLEHLRDVFS